MSTFIETDQDIQCEDQVLSYATILRWSSCEDHFKMATFFEASGCDRQKHSPGREVDIDGDARDMVSRGKEH